MERINKKMIYVVTGDKHGRGPDPGMKYGNRTVKKLRRKLPDEPEMIVCGTGRWHRDITSALGFVPTSFTILAGTADSYRESKNGAKCVFADGTKVPATTVTSTCDIRDAVRVYVRNTLLHDTVVCASTSFLYALQSALGIQNEVLPATVYRIEIDHGGHILIVKL